MRFNVPPAYLVLKVCHFSVNLVEGQQKRGITRRARRVPVNRSIHEELLAIILETRSTYASLMLMTRVKLMVCRKCQE